jgi:GH25 family lysozyme M1 (1,4-beta-N-acetylmuramidase)
MTNPPVSFAVDVSSHQDSHQPWRGFGVHMGIAKASEGQHSHDEWFGRHMADIKAAGLTPGAYHFAWPNQDVAAEAENYVSAVRPVNRRDVVHVLDLEPYPNGAKNYTGRSDAQIRAWADRWVALVRAAFPGQRVLAYTPRDAYARHFPAGTDGYWYPAYPVQGRSFATAASIARPVVGGHSVWGWQFTSVPLDRTVIYMSPGDLRTWAAGATSTTPTLEEHDMTPDQDARLKRVEAALADLPHAQWAYRNEGMAKKDPKLPQAYGYLIQTNAAVKGLTAQVAALTATVSALATKGGLTAAEITAAAKAGADAALAELGDALTKEN